MKIEVTKDTFLKGLQRAARALAGRGASLPVLSSIFISAAEGGVILRATNLELGIEVKIPAKVLEDGEAAVSGNTLSSFISQVPGRTLSIILDDGNLRVSSEKTRTTLKATSPDDFPSLPYIAGESLKLKAIDLSRGLRSVWYSASISGIKPELMSVSITSVNGVLTFAATDSFRLAEKKIILKENLSFDTILLPLKSTGDIIKILEEEEGNVTITFTKNQISFSLNDTYITSRLIDGSFPDYTQIIPKKFPTEAIILREDIIQALKLAHIFTDKFNQVNITISSGKKEMTISTRNPDIGETKETISAKITGEDISINFNYKYLADCLSSFGSDQITFSFGGANRPLVISGGNDRTFMYLVMPMNR